MDRLVDLLQIVHKKGLTYFTEKAQIQLETTSNFQKATQTTQTTQLLFTVLQYLHGVPLQLLLQLWSLHVHPWGFTDFSL